MASLRPTAAFIGFVLVLVAACGPTVVVPPGPIVDIPPGLHPRLTVADVSTIAFGQIHSMEAIAGRVLRPSRIVRVTAIRGGPAAPGFDAVTWMVDAEGTFATDHGRMNRPVVPAAPTGHFQIADADGTITGFGFP